MRTLLAGLVALVLGTAAALAQSTYSIRPGDTLQIEVLEDSSLNRSTLVLPDGTISFPLAGTLRVAGRSVATVRSMLTRALEPDFAAEPTVFVNVASLAERAPAGPPPEPEVTGIYAMGEVASPGRIEAEPGVTLLQALAQVGGFTRFAATKRVELHRTDPRTGREKVYRYDYRGREGISGSTVLQEGDVIVVPERRLFE